MPLISSSLLAIRDWHKVRDQFNMFKLVSAADDSACVFCGIMLCEWANTNIQSVANRRSVNDIQILCHYWTFNDTNRLGGLFAATSGAGIFSVCTRQHQNMPTHPFCSLVTRRRPQNIYILNSIIAESRGGCGGCWMCFLILCCAAASLVRLPARPRCKSSGIGPGTVVHSVSSHYCGVSICVRCWHVKKKTPHRAELADILCIKWCRQYFCSVHAMLYWNMCGLCKFAVMAQTCVTMLYYHICWHILYILC